MMRSIAIGVAMGACVSTALAKEVIQEFSWSEVKKTGGPIVGEILPPGPSGSPEQLRFDNPSGKSKTVTLFDLKNPAITSFHYAVEGSVRCENVSARSYLDAPRGSSQATLEDADQGAYAHPDAALF